MNLIARQMKWSLSPSVLWTFKLLSHSYSSVSLALLEGKQKDNCIYEHGKIRICDKSGQWSPAANFDCEGFWF